MEFFRETFIVPTLGLTLGQALSTVLVLWGGVTALSPVKAAACGTIKGEKEGFEDPV